MEDAYLLCGPAAWGPRELPGSPNASSRGSPKWGPGGRWRLSGKREEGCRVRTGLGRWWEPKSRTEVRDYGEGGLGRDGLWLAEKVASPLLGPC